MQKFYKKKMIKNFEFEAKIACGSKKIDCKAFLDSGNMLFDSITNMPINFVSIGVFEKLFENISFMDVIQKSEKLKRLPLAHFEEFSTLGGSGKVFVFQVDEMVVGENCAKNVLCGLSVKNMGKKFGADIVLNSAFAQI